MDPRRENGGTEGSLSNGTGQPRPGQAPGLFAFWVVTLGYLRYYSNPIRLGYSKDMENTNNPKVYRNESKDLTVRFDGEAFVIIGDAKRVSDKTILALSAGTVPGGWAEQAAW